jgi:hypothetical protein
LHVRICLSTLNLCSPSAILDVTNRPPISSHVNAACPSSHLLYKEHEILH